MISLSNRCFDTCRDVQNRALSINYAAADVAASWPENPCCCILSSLCHECNAPKKYSLPNTNDCRLRVATLSIDRSIDTNKYLMPVNIYLYESFRSISIYGETNVFILRSSWSIRRRCIPWIEFIATLSRSVKRRWFIRGRRDEISRMIFNSPSIIIKN